MSVRRDRLPDRQCGFQRASLRRSVLSFCAALAIAAALNATAFFAGEARAEVSELRLARQYGISHLAMAIMDQLQLVQRQAEKAGLKDLKVTWSRFSDGPGMNEALLSGNLDIANGGLTALIVLWDKSKGAYVGLSALSSMPAVYSADLPESCWSKYPVPQPTSSSDLAFRHSSTMGAR